VLQSGFLTIVRYCAAVAFAFVESLLHSRDRDVTVKRALDTLNQSFQMLESVGFEKLVFEDFYEVLEGLVVSITNPAAGKSLDGDSLLAAFQDDTRALRVSHSDGSLTRLKMLVSNSIVMYLRMVTVSCIVYGSWSYSDSSKVSSAPPGPWFI